MSVPQVGEETVRHQNSDVLTGVVSLSGKSLAVGPGLTQPAAFASWGFVETVWGQTLVGPVYLTVSRMSSCPGPRVLAGAGRQPSILCFEAGSEETFPPTKYRLNKLSCVA